MPVFKDNFSQQADIYARYRPHYPDALYDYLASLTPGHSLVWDCGTGNGQAATSLVQHYDRVIATDPSAQQIAQCKPHERITYLVEKGEQSSLAAASADIVTIANALHWFSFDDFYTEVRRVVKPGGIIAAWCYQVPFVNAAVDELSFDLHNNILGNYWQAENRLVDKEYTTLPFPFEEIASPAFTSQKMMDRETFIAYLNTWSAVQRYINDKGINPTDELAQRIYKVWPAGVEQQVTWKLVMKVGRI